MTELAGWIAPIATMIAAMMTAANLGARVTGWGFVVFVIGSVCWTTVGIGTDQANLLWTNAFLTLVNIVGVWRWLGRQARYDDGGEAAARHSAAAHVPTLFPASSLVGAKLTGAGGAPIGTVVDAMTRCKDGQLAYVVASEGGMGGVGERLHALDPAGLRFSHECISCDLSADQLAALPELEADHWPEALPPISKR
jgi:PRC-barrel domain